MREPTCSSQKNASKLPRPFVDTCGEVFSDGTTINLICDARTSRLNLLLSIANSRKVAAVVEYAGRTYKPAPFDSSIRSALLLPKRCNPFGSTVRLFVSVRNLFLRRGFPEDVVFPIPYFIFATWFLEVLPAAPCLVIGGPRPESELLLQLLECTVRQPLRLGLVTSEVLCALPAGFHATILTEQSRIASTARDVLKASNHRNVYIPWRGGLRNPFFSKIYLAEGKDAEPHFTEGVLRINLPPIRGRYPVLDDAEKAAIAAEFQAKLLAYRCQNIRRVRVSSCDWPHFASTVRVLGRILGAPIVDAPELQADLEPLLRDYHEQSLGGREVMPECVVVEALLHFCHRGLGGGVFVHEITEVANTILKGRDASASLVPEQTGRLLRDLGLTPKRNSQGSTLALDRTVGLRVHELARRLQVAAAQVGLKKCPMCESIPADETQASGGM